MPRKRRARTPAKPPKPPKRFLTRRIGPGDPIYPTLADYLVGSGDTQINLAKVFRVSQATVSRIASGMHVPGPELATLIASYCRIPLDSFTLCYTIRQRALR